MEENLKEIFENPELEVLFEAPGIGTLKGGEGCRMMVHNAKLDRVVDIPFEAKTTIGQLKIERDQYYVAHKYIEFAHGLRDQWAEMKVELEDIEFKNRILEKDNQKLLERVLDCQCHNCSHVNIENYKCGINYEPAGLCDKYVSFEVNNVIGSFGE